MKIMRNQRRSLHGLADPILNEMSTEPNIPYPTARLLCVDVNFMHYTESPSDSVYCVGVSFLTCLKQFTAQLKQATKQLLSSNREDVGIHVSIINDRVLFALTPNSIFFYTAMLISRPISNQNQPTVDHLLLKQVVSFIDDFESVFPNPPQRLSVMKLIISSR